MQACYVYTAEYQDSLEAHTHGSESVTCKPEGLEISYVVGTGLRRSQTRTETCVWGL